ncbi:hypothetical protein GINT2_000012 [Glugoides intestinalis]
MTYIQDVLSNSNPINSRLSSFPINDTKMNFEKRLNSSYYYITPEIIELNKIAPQLWEFVIAQPKTILGFKLADDKECLDKFKKVLKAALLYWGNGKLALTNLSSFSHIELILEALVSGNSSYSKKVKINEIIMNIKNGNPMYVHRTVSNFFSTHKVIVLEMLDAMCNKFCRVVDSIDQDGFESILHKKMFEALQAQALLELAARGVTFIPPCFEKAYKILTKEEKKLAYKTVLEQLKKREYKIIKSIIDFYEEKMNGVEFKISRKSSKLLIAEKSNNRELFDKFFDAFIEYLKSFNLLETYKQCSRK